MCATADKLIMSGLSGTKAVSHLQGFWNDAVSPVSAGGSDFQVAEKIAHLFLEGFGISYHGLNHRLIGTAQSYLESNKLFRSLKFTSDFPADSSYYHEASLDITDLPHRFRHTSDHRLISYEIGDRLYPIQLVYHAPHPRGDHLPRVRRMIELMRKWHSNRTHELVISAMVAFAQIAEQPDNMNDLHISYQPIGSGSDELPVFPGVYPPATEYTNALMKCAVQNIESRLRTADDVRALVLGSGSGVEAARIARDFGLTVDCTDISSMAVANTWASALFLGLHHKIRAWQSDGFDSVEDKYDIIIFCAPLAIEYERESINLYDTGGNLLRRIFQDLPNRLNEGGSLLLMSHHDIDKYVPALLNSERILPFRASGVPLAIHRISLAP